jgi:hypothetical protein
MLLNSRGPILLKMDSRPQATRGMEPDALALGPGHRHASKEGLDRRLEEARLRDHEVEPLAREGHEAETQGRCHRAGRDPDVGLAAKDPQRHRPVRRHFLPVPHDRPMLDSSRGEGLVRERPCRRPELTVHEPETPPAQIPHRLDLARIARPNQESQLPDECVDHHRGAAGQAGAM